MITDDLRFDGGPCTQIYELSPTKEQDLERNERGYFVLVSSMMKVNLTQFPWMGNHQQKDRSKCMDLCSGFSSLNSYKSQWSEITLSNHKRVCDLILNDSNISSKPTVHHSTARCFSWIIFSLVNSLHLYYVQCYSPVTKQAYLVIVLYINTYINALSPCTCTE